MTVEEILTIRGMMPLSALTYTEGVDRDDDEMRVSWQEWRAIDGEIVKRSVAVNIKKPMPIFPVQGTF